MQIDNMTNHMWYQCKLPLSSGGFGIDIHKITADIAFTASAFACAKDLNTTFSFLATDWSSGNDIDWMFQVKDAMGLAFYAVDEAAFDMNIVHFMFDVHTLPPSQHKINMHWHTQQKAIFQELVFHKLSDTGKANLLSVQRPESGAFLTALPKDDLTRLSSEQFRVACRSRLCAPHTYIEHFHRCQFCHDQPLIGSMGEHFFVCKFGNQSHEKHNAIRDTLIKLCASVGISTVKEPTSLYQTQTHKSVLIFVCVTPTWITRIVTIEIYSWIFLSQTRESNRTLL